MHFAVPRSLAVALAAVLVMLVAAVGAGAASAAEISGVAFKDLNRDGVKQADEEPLAGKEIYVFDASGGAVGHAPTDSSGRYTISGMPSGTYSVRYGTVDWWGLWQDFAPSTTGSERPTVTVQLSERATADFGWRPIVRSADVNAPISTYVASDGLRINSYNDVVSAKKIYDTLTLGTLRGAEAAYTTIRFDYRPTDYCETSTTRVNGVYGDYRAICHVSYLAWLDEGEIALFHEYGHAWSLYYANIVQQDPALDAYLRARSLAGDSRLWSTEQWSPREMIAEDYRQLFGTAATASWPQANREIPPAAGIPGLGDFLSGPFMMPPSPTPPPPPAPAPTLHVASVNGSAAKSSRGWTATATATIVEGSGQPVAGAAVGIRWSNAKTGASGQLSCTTKLTGSCSAAVDFSTKVDSVTLTVTSVSKESIAYDAGSNESATTVTVKRPR